MKRHHLIAILAAVVVALGGRVDAVAIVEKSGIWNITFATQDPVPD